MRVMDSQKLKSNDSNSNFRYDLTPLKTPRPGKPFSVSDIESRNWIDFLIIGHYDGNLIHHFETLSTYLDFVFSHDHSDVFFHFGGIF